VKLLNPEPARLKHESMCLRKRGYSTKMFALGVAMQIQELRGTMLTTYKCPSCYQWHLTKARK
jgi:hypothetical protein